MKYSLALMTVLASATISILGSSELLGQSESGMAIEVRVDLAPNPDDGHWAVGIEASGLADVPQPLELRLVDWGSWSRADSLFFRNLRTNVPLESVDSDPTRLLLKPDSGWDGTLEVSYQVSVTEFNSNARENFGLMPWQGPSYGQGFSSNTLMDLFAGDRALKAERIIEFHTDDDLIIVTGWGDASKGMHRVILDHPIDNTAILYGNPSGHEHSRLGATTLEVTQFGAGQEMTSHLTPKVKSLLTTFAETTGIKIEGPMRVVLTDTGGGGVNVDGALIVGYDARRGIDSGLLMTTAHELFHEWLGGDGAVKVHNPQSVWFQEGFTDYLATWNLARVGLISDQEFLDRLVWLNDEVQENPAKGEIRFGDPSVQWRDDDGPNELMAYRGGALLAFFTDAELRRNDQPGLSKMIADLANQGRIVTNKEIKQWYDANDLDEFHTQFVERSNLPNLGKVLESLGCHIAKIDQDIAYAGIAIDNEGPFGVITKLDMNGPAAKAGAMVGDRITGFWPVSSRQLEFPDGHAFEFPFGVSSFVVGETSHITVERNGQAVTLDFKPKTISKAAYIKRVEFADRSLFRSLLGFE